jgi:C-terminal processing protease CtpA/Prc
VTHGLEVTHVYANSPAQWTGIQPGDVITSVNGQPVNSEEDIARAIAKRNSGRVGVSLYRNGRLLDFDMEPNPISVIPPPVEVHKNVVGGLGTPSKSPMPGG